MRAERRWRRRGSALLSSLLLLLSQPSASAQNVTEPALKGALIHNFAKYTAWLPEALPAQAPFVACVLGDRNVADALERSVRGRTLSNRPITVSFVKADGPLRTCHLLYISAVPDAQAEAVLAAVRGAPVLTMVDLEHFQRRAAIVRVFVDRGTLRFDIDVWLARQSRLELSSQVLSLASKTYAAAGTLRVTP